jgi:hypothetical protein
MKTLLPTTAALALLAAASVSLAMAQAPKPEAQEDQSRLREILADLAAGRNVSARVGLPLQIGFSKETLNNAARRPTWRTGRIS